MNGTLTPEFLFSVAGQAAMAGWLILIFLPRHIKPLFMIPQYLIPFGLGLLYGGLALSNFFTNEGGYGTLTGVRTLFENDYMLLAGWVHYLAFDLFIGAWIAREADLIGMSRLIQPVLLIATFMFGPVGLVLFLVMRAAFHKPAGEVAHA
jgi:hypothetical protein